MDIPKETEVTAFVQGDMHLAIANFGASGPLPTGAGFAPSTAAETAVVSLNVESSALGADIEVDGGFCGKHAFDRIGNSGTTHDHRKEKGVRRLEPLDECVG